MFRFGDPGGRAYGVAADVTLFWTSKSNFDGDVSLPSGGGRHTGTCLRCSSGGNPAGGQWCSLSKVIDSQPTLGCAFAFRCSYLPSGWQIMAFYDGGSLQCDLRINNNGSVSITRNGTTLGSTQSVVWANCWVHLECKVTFHPTAGVAQLWVNGASLINLSNINTRASSNSNANTLLIGGANGTLPGNASFQYDYDDLVCYDAQSQDANSFTDITGPVGDCYLNCLFPTGAGSTTQWTPDSGSNYARVNENVPDGDLSYVASSNVGNTDTYPVTQLPVGATTVPSVVAVHYARKNDRGYRAIRSTLRSGGSNTPYGRDSALTTTYQYLSSNFGQDPNNGISTNWTATAVNSLEVGQKLTA